MLKDNGLFTIMEYQDTSSTKTLTSLGKSLALFSFIVQKLAGIKNVMLCILVACVCS
jgi:hypothetical protein